MEKEEAKKIWKNIKKKHYVSKFYWDNYMHEYDCYCNFCKSYSINNNNNNNWSHKSWVSNPNTGFVWRSDSEAGCKEYKGQYYIPCPADLYEKLVFFNEDQYKDAIKNRHRTYKTFDELWEESLSQEKINSNENIEGGAYRKIKSSFILAKDSVLPENDEYEKVVTLGWHKTDILGAISCPVCEDIYNVIYKSDYNPLPWYKKLRENIVIMLKEM